MLIDIDTYIDNIKDKSVEGLVKERNKILRQIDHYEKNKDHPEMFDIYPTPLDTYKWSNLVLIELTNMIMSRS